MRGRERKGGEGGGKANLVHQETVPRTHSTERRYVTFVISETVRIHFSLQQIEIQNFVARRLALSSFHSELSHFSYIGKSYCGKLFGGYYYGRVPYAK